MHPLMNRRIRFIWVLSIATMMLILCGQLYWLYNQYLYSTQDIVRNMQTACDSVLEREYEIRYDRYHERLKENKKVEYTMKVQVRDSILLKLEYGGSGKRVITFTFSAHPAHPQTKTVTLLNASSENSARYVSRYLTQRVVPLSRHLIDSLLEERGYGPMQNAQIRRSKVCVQPCRFSQTGRVLKTLHVEFSTNPFGYQLLRFDIAVPVSGIIRSMAWQLAGSLLLMLILAFCLISQMRTIVIQKRIDKIRREFLKNMIYEMKQPEEPGCDGEAIHIGNTLFYYTLNELRHGSNRVIITSRQAELLRLLAETPNEVVPREKILQQIWGDDSYANSLALNVQVTYLRRALKSDPTLSIEAVIKRGYVLKTSS